jgi:SOS-response transcriptional repressor LexA
MEVNYKPEPKTGSKQRKSAQKVAAQRKTPTKSEHIVLTFIAQFINQHGYGPSYREIMRGCGYSTLSVVSLHIDALVQIGYLEKKDRGARSLSLTEKAKAPKASLDVEKTKICKPKNLRKMASRKN